IWLPIVWGTDRILSASVVFYDVIGRLRPGVALAQARAEMDLVSNRLHEQSPKPEGRPDNIQVIPLEQFLVKDIRTAVVLLIGAVGFVLLIACINVANLLLARAATRGREFATRAALGATRVRLLRQLLVESLLLALMGGALGLLIAMWNIDSLIAMIPT